MTLAVSYSKLDLGTISKRAARNGNLAGFRQAAVSQVTAPSPAPGLVARDRRVQPWQATIGSLWAINGRERVLRSPVQITDLLTSRGPYHCGGSSESLETPAFVYDEGAVSQLLRFGELLRVRADCRVLFSLKPFSFLDLLEHMAPSLDGFAVSSLFEARLARSVIGGPNPGRGTLHLTTPGIRPNEVQAIGELCDYVSFNSLSQWDRHREGLGRNVSSGLRVNPRLSFLDDERYDPCRPDSKLGAPMEEVASLMKRDPARLDGIEGLQVHTNCESTDFNELAETVNSLNSEIGGLLHQVKWINLGGGYLFDDSVDLAPLFSTIEFLKSAHNLEVYIEPGAAFIRSAGYIVSTVLDLFDNGAKNIAILDTTINHMPEVFEYDFEPDILGHDDGAQWEYLLAGCTCLAGDLFGEYRFHRPLAVGDKVIFCNAGAYTMTKAHLFNGINLPSIYALTKEGNLVLKKRFTYDEFAARWGAYAVSPG